MTLTSAQVDARPADGVVAGPTRLTSLDAFRGATMLFMASEILRIPSLARAYPDSPVARFLASMLDHRQWVGCAPWDLIQPAFMFMVGVSLPFSVASRRARGQSFQQMLVHSVFRAVMLVALGIFLRSDGRALRRTSRSRTCSRRSGSATSSCFCWRGRRPARSGRRRC